MSNFFKILFGSCLGTFLALGALFFIGISAIAGLASAGEQKPSVENNSILKLDLTQVPELTGNVDAGSGFSGLEFDMDEVVGVHDVIRTIERAKTDDNIKGIYLNSGMQGGGFTKLRMIREALADFRESGKFVMSYAPYYEQSAYYLSTAADEIYVGPLGVIDFRGIGGEIMFYKGMMEKVGVDVEVFYAGQFKSATEPFRRKSMSDQSREQTREYLGDMFTYMVDDIAEARGLSSADIRSRANTLAGWKGEEAVSGGLIDGIKRRSEVDARLRELVGFEADEKLKTISHEKYFAARMSKLRGRGNSEVAVLIAEGNIIDGKGANGNIGDTKYVKEIERLTEDDDVKAVVLRVNSGGGSASSSENIWYAAEQLKAAGKPFVVSMGSVAASGGYYIAAGADSIFAEPSTITGSIGVFTMFPKDDGLMDKIGLTLDTVNTAKHANGLSPFRPLAEEERAMLQQRTQAIYATFLDRVAEGRNLPLETVKEIAQGRVYAGNRALELGLVDRLAGLDAAIASAARMAGLDTEDISVGHYPKIKPPLEQLIEDLLGEDAAKGFGNAMLKDQLGAENYEYFQMMREMTQSQGVQARMLVKINF
ncbi:signal peptide peptidase SppA [Neolewinella persica]|uniref:signal peptide peptidase SppA n=1 Tax=Neolewinella persica TaxID=70998 RepID=UPI000362CBFC|nr:signal peptide peptidase SppA [Neolewinella persica]